MSQPNFKRILLSVALIIMLFFCEPLFAAVMSHTSNSNSVLRPSKSATIAPVKPYQNISLIKKKRVFVVAACLMQWTDEVQLPDRSQIETLVGKVDEYFQELSYNQAGIELGPMAIVHPTGELPTSLMEEENIAVQLCDPLIDFNAVDILWIFPSTQAGLGMAESNEDRPSIHTDEKEIKAVVLIGHYGPENGFINHVIEDYITTVFVHELLHNSLFNYIGHASTLECGDTSFSMSGCTSIMYGNRYDVMSAMSGHASAWSKYKAGPWLTQTTVRRNGQYELAALELPFSQPQLIRIPFTPYPVCLEYRKPIGIDLVANQIILRNLVPAMPAEGCLFIYICPGKDRHRVGPLHLDPKNTFLLDSTPASQADWTHVDSWTPEQRANWPDMSDSCLVRGRVFGNEELGIQNLYYENTGDADIINVHLDINERLLELITTVPVPMSKPAK